MYGSENNDTTDSLTVKLHPRHVAATWNEEVMKVNGRRRKRRWRKKEGKGQVEGREKERERNER